MNVNNQQKWKKADIVYNLYCTDRSNDSATYIAEPKFVRATKSKREAYEFLQNNQYAAYEYKEVRIISGEKVKYGQNCRF